MERGIIMEDIRRIRRELVYKGKILNFYEDYMALPNGNTAVWDFIEHKGAAAVVPVTSDGKILMSYLLFLALGLGVV